MEYQLNTTISTFDIIQNPAIDIKFCNKGDSAPKNHHLANLHQSEEFEIENKIRTSI